MKNTIAIILLFIFSGQLTAQNYTISGYVKDSASGEALIGASIFVKGTHKGSVSNNYGFYSLTLPSDSVSLWISFVGYKTIEKTLLLNTDTTLNFDLKPSINIKGVTITSNRNQGELESTRMSTINVPMKTLKELPVIMGEVDLIKAIQLLPGVQSGTEGSGGLYVRGGGPDQNLILLDGVPVYNANHLFGFFSIFNADAIKKVELVKGGFPARYGGRLSSVLDISMKEGNMKKIRGEGSIGLISAKLTLEGPIIKDKTSFIVSARRTYFDALTSPFMGNQQNGANGNSGYFFYDLNAKINHIISPRDRIYLSFYNGKDEFYNRVAPYQYLYEGVIFEEQMKNELNWGNLTSTLRWNHQYNSKLFSNFTLTTSRYKYQVIDYRESIEQNDTATLQSINSLQYKSGITDYGGRMDFDYIPNTNHYIKFGLGSTLHSFEPGASSFHIKSDNITNVDSITGSKAIGATEVFAYIEDDYRISQKLKINLGLHYSGFSVDGEYYNSLQPRIMARYLLNKSVSLKASYASMQQYVHLLTNSGIGLPTDLWIPATRNVTPQRSSQVALGMSTYLPWGLNFSIEGYYKIMKNVIEYKDGASFMDTNDDWESKVESGKGKAYGLEFFLEKREGRFHGWLGYTIAKSERTFENINNGNSFPYKYDRTHDISVVGSYEINDKWDFSAAWVYGTGNALTLPVVRYKPLDGGLSSMPISAYETKNSFRAAAYHRLDVTFRRTIERKWGELIYNFGVYNLYNRKNPFYYYIGQDPRGNRSITRVSIFPFIPSVSLSFKF